MQLGSVEVEVRKGFVVAARDEGGLEWAAARTRTMPRLLGHVLVMAAVAAPFGFTAASAHPAASSGRAEARMTMQSAALAAQIDHRSVRLGLPEPVASAPAPAPTPDPVRPFADRAPVVGSGGHFSFGWCTWYVSTRRYVPWTGNAIDWFRNAAAMGFPEGRGPRVGAIMVSRESGWGHVAYVQSVDADGWTVSEMNYKGFGVVDTRHILPGQVPLVGFIY